MTASNREDKSQPVASPAISALARNLADFAEASLIDLPIAAAKRLARRGSELELNEAGWKAYDGFISIVNQTTSNLYSSRRFGAFAGRSTELGLRAQRLNQALAGAFFTTLWSALGLPTAQEVEALREDVRGLRGEVRAAAASRPEAAEPAAVREEPRDREDPLAAEYARRFDVNRAMSTTGIFRAPMFMGWPVPESKEARSSVRN
jgi:hypothetical protein